MLIILDDDPTGTQTTRDLPILTEWSVESLRAEFDRSGDAVFLLTNSRALPEPEAAAINREIARNLKIAADGRDFTLISRGDSTLRGHFPLETDVLSEELGPFDATILIPFFEAGGRLTQNDIHYVREGDMLVPVAETPFAKDPSFGFTSSNLRDYIEEKSHGRIPATQVASISLDQLRHDHPQAIADTILSWPKGCHAIVNAVEPADLDAFVAGLKIAQCHQRHYLFRTAAEFVAAYLGQKTGQLLDPFSLDLTPGIGGLIVVGSHVPKTSTQLKALLATGIASFELPVPSLLDDSLRSGTIQQARQAIESSITQGKDIVLFTSRERIDGRDAADSLAIASRISSALVEVVAKLSTAPRYLVAKGGITSSDLATDALRIRRAMVVGQILPGVPLWQAGPESLFPGIPYIVFPGNVGSDDALANLSNQLNP